MENKLKPCPFCGGEALLDVDYQTPFGNIQLFYVICRSCLAKSRKETRKDIAVEIWNRRTEVKDDV